MADPISVIGTLSSLISLVSVGIKTAAKLYEFSNSIFLSSPTEHALRESKGKYAIFLLKVFLPDTLEQLERIDQSVLPGTDEVVLAFKNSYISDCTQTAVAGAIVAQIAVTALSLPYLSQTHWVARAFFIFGLISGLLSVYYAVLLQRTIGTLYQTTDIKDWLSTRNGYPDVSEISQFLEEVESTQEALNKEIDLADVTRISSLLENADRDLYRATATARGSLFSALMLATPSNLINVSLGSLVIGLAVYLGFLWTRSLDTSAGPNDSRNVFIVYLVCVWFCISSYAAPHGLKDREVIPVRLYRRLLVSYEALKRELAVKIFQLQHPPSDLDSVFRPIPKGKESILPVQTIGDVHQVPKNAATVEHTHQQPFHASQAGDDVLFTAQAKEVSSQQAEKESRGVVAVNNAANMPTDFTASTSLISALQAAAQAREASANADRKVAEAYEQLVNSMTARDDDNATV